MSTLTTEKRAQAYLIREQIQTILQYLPGVVKTTTLTVFEDEKVRITFQTAVGSETQVLIKPVASSSSASSGTPSVPTPVLVYAATEKGITVFRHSARWISYIEDLVGEAQDIADAAAAAEVDTFSTIDDEDLFPTLSPGGTNIPKKALADAPKLDVIETTPENKPGLVEVVPRDHPAVTGEVPSVKNLPSHKEDRIETIDEEPTKKR